jgi:hypothetical protein
LTDYLISLGMSRDDTSAWVRARWQGRSFKIDASDAMGDHLDKVWNRRTQENDALSQLKDPGEIRQEHQRNRLATCRIICAALCIYGFLCWMYVIAFQMVNPNSVYWPLAVWLPWVRMDYFGETGIITSFLFGILWAKLRHGSLVRRNETSFQ